MPKLIWRPVVSWQWPGLAALRLLLILQILPRLWHLVQLPHGSHRASESSGIFLMTSAAAVGRDKTVYWNASNPLFQPSGENVLYVNTLDRINFVCPNNGMEYYRIYWTTSRDNYQSCSGGSPLFNCRTMESYLVIVQIFAADPTAPVFLTPVYFYTPSTGELTGLDQTVGGACETRNLRLTVRTDSDTGGSDSGSQFTSSASTSAAAPTTVAAGSSLRPTKNGSTVDGEAATTGSAAATGAPGATTRDGRQQPGVTTRKDAEHPDYSRMNNLITGSSVAMPTAFAVVSLASLRIVLTTVEYFA